ncbi:hypothetical protein MO973_05410 [Paenibacillus sp. TRM 82003]|nr:hypothetical protein [Paenibacillus sp. TRM 82003]
MIDQYQKISDLMERLGDLKLQYWLEHDLFKPHWWFLLAASIIPWIIWWYKGKRQPELITHLLLWMIVSSLLDELGVSLHLWEYPKSLIALMPPLLPADLSVIPISFTFIYQYFPRGKSYFIGVVVLSAIFSFVIEPVFEMLHLFNMNLIWGHFYSFAAFIPTAYLVRWLTEKILGPSAR